MIKSNRFYLTVIAVFAVFISFTGKSSAQYLTHFDFEERNFGFTFSYVNQQMEYHMGDFSDYGNGIWSNGKERLNGVGVGFIVDGTFGAGVGIFWGMDLEYFSSSNNPSGVGNTIEDQYDKYMEAVLGMPLHIQYKLPISDKIAIGTHLGPGLSLSVLAGFTSSNGYEDVDILGAENGMRMLNVTFDAAIYLEWGKVRFDVIWSNGLVDYKRNPELIDKTFRNKFMFGLSLLGGIEGLD